MLVIPRLSLTGCESKVDLITTSTVKRTGGDIIDIRDTSWPSLSTTTSSGDQTHTLAIACVKAKAIDDLRVVYALVIPEAVERTGYKALLEVP